MLRSYAPLDIHISKGGFNSEYVIPLKGAILVLELCLFFSVMDSTNLYWNLILHNLN